jgi:hypothetical protein
LYDDDFISCLLFFNLTLKLQFVAEKINKQHDKAAVEASMAKQEDEKAQTAPSSQSTQAVKSNKTSEGTLAFIIGVLWSLL